MSDPRSELRAVLAEPREIIDRLSDEEATTLLASLRRAQTRQQQSLDSAINSALEVLPRLVRIPARKILFGR
ncbi:hypothetical protein IU469_30485 [Nocardia puris]|uniref:Uncharacterized protein n=1 Tax=Nocardia puris TaxID=208602 RepID=A0A366CXP7_9NOCA|nr:hypothetical protein [Nocardia puris]MBF6215376.1 hypothetical protein [Nocardia puris]MBF6370004.1 hypothetical protein [Nocardia puris]RBO82385.1 hypothetical protein DFR74_1232 [Nocardia puris]